jgi:hypothetical protein
MASSTSFYVFLYAVRRRRPAWGDDGVEWGSLPRAAAARRPPLAPRRHQPLNSTPRTRTRPTHPRNTHTQVHYYAFKTRMSGLFQTAFYFGYTAMFCLALALM